ncbi:MAG: DMT family transporter, partial [Bacteroidota bacterium]
GSLILCIIYLKYLNISFWGKHTGLLISRGVIGTISMALFFLTIKEIPFGSAVTLRYLSPIFAGLLAMYWLKEKITSLQWLFFITAFIGVVMLKGFDPRVTILGLVLILFSALFSGVVYVIIRKIGTREHPAVVVLYFMICATIIGGLLSIFHWNTPNMRDWIILLSLGVFGFIGQIYMTKAYQIASIGYVAPMKYIESVFALLLGWIWFDEAYGIWSLFGIAIIVGSMLLNIILKK